MTDLQYSAALYEEVEYGPELEIRVDGETVYITEKGSSSEHDRKITLTRKQFDWLRNEIDRFDAGVRAMEGHGEILAEAAE